MSYRSIADIQQSQNEFKKSVANYIFSLSSRENGVGFTLGNLASLLAKNENTIDFSLFFLKKCFSFDPDYGEIILNNTYPYLFLKFDIDYIENYLENKI